MYPNDSFFSVWRNNYLKDQILYHLKLYRENYCKRFITLKEFRDYRYASYIVDLNYGINEIFSKADIPASVETLTISSDIELPLSENIIPDTVRTLKFINYNYPVSKKTFPSTIKSLIVSSFFNQYLDPGILPSSLTHLELGDSYNQPLLPNAIPPTVTTLKFGTEYSNGSYRQIISPNVIPNSVTFLSIGFEYISLYQLSIPTSVTRLHLYGTTDQPISPGQIPNSVKILKLKCFNKPILKKAIPESVTKLSLYEPFAQPAPFSKDIIPKSVTSLSISNIDLLTFKSIPKSVVKLKLGNKHSNNRQKQVLKPLVRSKPSILQKVLHHSNSDVNSMETLIPPSVKTLVLNLNIKLVPHSISTSITSLRFGFGFEENIYQHIQLQHSNLKMHFMIGPI
ncbi:hypothetical protein DICPUDRAFT_146675 [Dictyostelium purpureum]|uniref:FNIP repeat-containing protein n=1 Tax=Dictyostelium purpureum TaxID=5786 RepID=F0Z6K8_DICPU|nr:uncharacterized protein DICPUDRAFT_146675 [Dictyostelium purpureum]EGC40454.1 hypothetical protein DICPUDRAFT_146675 [Dictyostelium purpureum]|eukprot:XP_003283001.1 hypothetical protein DICPUDRAFT_146675 [Dictyostelium purpureum]